MSSNANRQSVSAFRVGSALLALGFAFIVVYPVLRMLGPLFYLDGRFQFSAFRALVNQPVIELLVSTLIVVVGSGVLAVLIGTFFAWANERTDARLGFVTGSLPLMPFLVPPLAGAIGWVLLLSPNAGLLNVGLRNVIQALGGPVLESGPLNIHSYYGLILVYTLYAVPYVVVLMTAGLRDYDVSLEEQSRICGAGHLATLRRVTVPALKPSLAGATLLMIWFGFALYSVPVVIAPRARVEVLSMRIVRLMRGQYPPQTADAVVLSLVTMVFVVGSWLLLRRILRQARFSSVGGKGTRSTQISLGRWKWPVRLSMLAYVVIGVILPVGALINTALMGVWRDYVGFREWDVAIFFEAILSNPLTRNAFRNSLVLSVIAATVGMLIAALISIYVHKGRTRLGMALDAAVKLPGTLPNIILAVGFILAFAGPPFGLHGTYLILILAYLAFYMPQASVASDAASGQVSRELTEASHVAGAGEGGTFLRISLPIMIPGLMAGWALLFSRMVGEVNAAAMLAGASNIVVGARMLDLLSGGTGSLAVLASLATALTFVAGTVLVLVLTVSRRFGARRST